MENIFLLLKVILNGFGISLLIFFVRILVLNIVGDFLWKVGVLEFKLVVCRNFVKD